MPAEQEQNIRIRVGRDSLLKQETLYPFRQMAVQSPPKEEPGQSRQGPESQPTRWVPSRYTLRSKPISPTCSAPPSQVPKRQVRFGPPGAWLFSLGAEPGHWLLDPWVALPGCKLSRRGRGRVGGPKGEAKGRPVPSPGAPTSATWQGRCHSLPSITPPHPTPRKERMQDEVGGERGGVLSRIP